MTVVEDFDLQALIQEPPKPPPRPPEDTARINHTTPSRRNDGPSTQKKTKKRPKDPKIHYETKSARIAERKKQRARQKEKADRAGGRRGKNSDTRKKGSK